MFKSFKNANIATRLIASFALIISIFISYIAISTRFSSQIERLQHHSSDFLAARMEILLLHHQEFSKMERLLRESFMNNEWLQNTGEAVWRSFEMRISATQVRMTELALAYADSILADDITPKRPDDSRLFIMEHMMEHINDMYQIYRNNFFLEGNRSYNHENAAELARVANVMVGALRELTTTNRIMSQERIDYYRDMSTGITITALIVSIVSVVWLAYVMVKSFTGRIKTIETEASLVVQGNFESALKNEGNDEISRIFANLVKVFTRLIDEIEGIDKSGNNRARINADRFEGGYKETALVINSLLDTITAAEERAKIMLDGNPIACYVVDKNLNILDCNNEAMSMFDFATKEQAIFNGSYIFSDHKLKNPFDVALTSGYSKFGWNFIKPDGTEIPCEVTLVRFLINDNEVVAVYFQDMSLFYQMLEQQQLLHIAEENSQAKTRFLARMSHEIRTPITAVLGISEIQLRGNDLTTASKEAFVKIHDSATILLNIINDILDISKIEAGKMDLISHKYNVASLVTDTVQLHLVYSGNKSLKFEVTVDESVPLHLYGDELRIKQILNNILANAFKYTDTGKVLLDVFCEYTQCQEGSNAILVLKIEDTGHGMTEDQLETILEEYTRFHEQKDRLTQGTGLGMSIVNNLIKLMGGEINVSSEVGVGSTFIVRIPQQICGSDVLGRHMARNLNSYDTTTLSSIEKLKFVPEPMPYGSVLIVDDVPTNLYVAKGLMSFYDLQIETAESGHVAINNIKEGKVYDVIFMDHMMPDIDGMETVKIIRELGYKEPIIALTANALIGQAEEFLKNGFDDFVSKPIQTSHLNDVLNKFVRDKQPAEILEAARKVNDGNGLNANSINAFLESEDAVYRLNRDFIKSQKDVVANVRKAVEEGNFEYAHRNVHTLKGLASLIGEKDIALLARHLEAGFAKKENPADLLEQLSGKMDALFVKIEETYPKRRSQGEKSRTKTSEDVSSELFDELTTLLEANNFAALDLLKELENVLQTDDLVEHIENADFDLALDTLVKLRPK